MKSYIAILLSLCNLLLTAQGGFRSRIYLPGAPDHSAKAIFETSPGSYIAAGFATDTTGGVGKICIAIMGLDNSGSLQWVKQHSGGKLFYLSNPFIARSFYKQGNNLYYAGCAKDTSNRQIGVFIKFDMNGDTVWQKILRDADPLEDVIPQMVTGSVDGGFLLTGFFQHWGPGGGTNCLLIKTDAFGNELWRKKISKAAPNTQDGKAIIQDSVSKQIVVVGYQYLAKAGTYGCVIILDSLGNELNRLIFTEGNFLDLVQLPDRSFVVSGQTTVTTPQNEKADGWFVARFTTTSGHIPIWRKYIDPGLHATGASCLRVLPDGDILIMGYVGINDTVHYMTNCHIRVIIMDTLGNTKWQKLYQYKNNAPNKHYLPSPTSLELTSDGGWVASFQLSHPPQLNPLFFVKYDSTGCDSTTAYCESLVAGVYKWKKAVRSCEIVPNPASGTVRITTDVSEGKTIGLEIKDISGKTVLVKKDYFPGKKLDVSGLQNGLYFVTIFEGNTALLTAKLVVQR